MMDCNDHVVENHGFGFVRGTSLNVLIYPFEVPIVGHFQLSKFFTGSTMTKP